MKRRAAWIQLLALVVVIGIYCLSSIVRVSAQVQTTKTTTADQSSHEVNVEHGEVVVVDGNDLIVKMDDGTLRHLANVPDSTKVNVNGNMMGVHELKPGMRLQRTIHTISTPKVITTTQTVTGKVWHVSPPNSVILTLENGENQKFNIPKGQKFTVNGQETDAFGLKKGMVVNATKVVEEPITVVERNQRLTGKLPPPPVPPAADQPILVATAAPAPAAAPTAEKTPESLPKTGSELGLLALLGCMSLAGAGGLRLLRKLAL